MPAMAVGYLTQRQAMPAMTGMLRRVITMGKRDTANAAKVVSDAAEKSKSQQADAAEAASEVSPPTAMRHAAKGAQVCETFRCVLASLTRRFLCRISGFTNPRRGAPALLNGATVRAGKCKAIHMAMVLPTAAKMPRASNAKHALACLRFFVPVPV